MAKLGEQEQREIFFLLPRTDLYFFVLVVQSMDLIPMSYLADFVSYALTLWSYAPKVTDIVPGSLRRQISEPATVSLLLSVGMNLITISCYHQASLRL